MKKSATHLSWENFRSTVFVKGEERVHRVSTSPLVEIYGDGVRNRVGIWLETPEKTTLPEEIRRLLCISADVRRRDGRTLIDISNLIPSLQRQFYYFAVAVAERITIEKKSAIDAVALELQCFSALFEEKPLLGIERQIGLLGELLLLERLIASNGPDALDTWIGPIGEPHDFRLETREFEVKTTVSPYRIHTIHGTEQLVPSQDCKLYLASVMLGPAGGKGGFTLVDKIDEVAARLSGSASHLHRFKASLEKCGYAEADRHHYKRRFSIRRPLGVVAVDRKFPAITRPVIKDALGSLASRIESLRYDVNIEGLEIEEGSPGFSKILPI